MVKIYLQIILIFAIICFGKQKSQLSTKDKFLNHSHNNNSKIQNFNFQQLNIQKQNNYHELNQSFQNTATTDSTNNQPQTQKKKQSYKEKVKQQYQKTKQKISKNYDDYKDAIDITGYVIVFGALIFLGLYWWRHQRDKSKIIDDHALNPEKDIQSQQLEKQQIEALHSYKFKSSNEENCVIIHDTNTQQNQEQDEEQSKCYELQFNGQSKIMGDVFGGKEKKGTKSKDYKYFEVEILQLTDPSTIIQIGYQTKDEYSKDLPLGESFNSVQFTNEGVVYYFDGRSKSSEENKKKKKYDYKLHPIERDKIFMNQEYNFGFVDRYIEQVKKKKKKDPMPPKIFEVSNQRKTVEKIADDEIQDNSDICDIENMNLVLPSCNRKDKYTFEFQINKLKNTKNQQMKIGICGSRYILENPQFNNPELEKIMINSTGHVYHPQLKFSEDPEEDQILREEDKDFYRQTKVDFFMYDNKDAFYQSINEEFKFKQDWTVSVTVDNHRRVVIFKTTNPSKKDSNSSSYQIIIPIPSIYKQVFPCAMVYNHDDQVTIQNGSIIPQKLGFGEVMGIGLSKSDGRVYLSLNGKLLNKPCIDDVRIMEEQDKNGKKKKKKKKFDFNIKGQQKDNDPDLDADMDDDQVDRELQKRRVFVDKKTIKDMAPVVKVDGACKLQINIGGEPFRLYQDNIQYGFL